MPRLKLPAPEAEPRWGPVLRAIAALPWAQARVLEAVCGLTTRCLRATAQTLIAAGWVEAACVPVRRRHGLARYGLTSSGARVLGRSWAPEVLRRALLTALQRDAAQYGLLHFMHQHRLLWVRGPYRLAAAAVRAPALTAPGARVRRAGARPYAPADLDLVVCLQRPDGAYLTAMVLVDPGGVSLDGLGESLRSLAAWTRRAEFAGRAREIPLLVILAATDRRAQVLRGLWSAAHQGPPSALRLVVAADLRSRAGEVGALSLLSGLPVTTEPSAPPPDDSGLWWAERGPGAEAPRPIRVDGARQSPSGVIRAARRWAKRAATTSARRASGSPAATVLDLLETSALGRVVLERIGLYPLATGKALAEILGQDGGDVRRAVIRLVQQGLVVREIGGGFGCWLSPRGLAFLAALAGLSAERYAQARHWSVRVSADGEVGVHVDGLRRQRRHDQRVFRFLRGLRRLDPARRIVLTDWQHGAGMLETLAGEVRLIPDARFTVRAYGSRPGQFVETTCWLEVDQATMEGRVLRRKLQRYYQLRRDRLGLRGRPERLLFVVPDAAEGRVQTLRRRIRELDAAHEVRLDAWITRWDLLRRGDGYDPTLPVWRTAHDPILQAALRLWRHDAATE